MFNAYTQVLYTLNRYIIFTIYLANELHIAKIKLKISDTVFHAWPNHQEEVVVVAGVLLL